MSQAARRGDRSMPRSAQAARELPGASPPIDTESRRGPDAGIRRSSMVRLTPKLRDLRSRSFSSVSRLVPHRPHPALSEGDLQYICSAYLPLEEIARGEGLPVRRLREWIADGRL